MDQTPPNVPRLLFTGTGERMIDNLTALIPDSYQSIRCACVENDLLRALKDTNPRVVLICLQNETRDMLRIYDCFHHRERFGHLPLMVIGYEEECSQFRQWLPGRTIHCFSRPLDRTAFLETLADLVTTPHPAPEASPEPDAPAPTPITAPTPDLFSLNGEATPRADSKALLREAAHMAQLYGRKSILVVDDDVNMLNAIKLYLQELYEVTVVPNGKLAIKFLAKKHADLVLLDYMMPDMDGPEVLRLIRSESPNPKVPVLFLTGVADKNAVLRGLEFRPNGYLLKPVSREILLERVTEITLGL